MTTSKVQAESRARPDPQTEPVISVYRLAAITGVSPSYIYELIRNGDPSIPVIRIGGRIMIPTVPILRMLDGSEAA